MARVVFPPGAPPPLWTHYNPISSKEFGGEPALHIGDDRLDLPEGFAFFAARGAAQLREHRP